jgi:anti-sigma factor RsiW
MLDAGDARGTGENGGDCARIDARLSELLVGDLPAAMRRELEPHLQRCGRCRSELAACAALAAELAVLPTTASPAASWNRIRLALAAERRSRPMPWLVQVGALAAAALVLAALLVRNRDALALWFLFGTIAALASLPLLSGSRRAALPLIPR